MGARLRPARLLLLILFFGLMSPMRAAAQRPLGIVDQLNIPRVGDPQLSPDGRTIAFTLAEADWKTGKRISHVWRIPAAGGPQVKLTAGADGETSPRWSPDGKWIAFVAKRGAESDPAQIYLLPTDGGEAQPLTKHETSVSEIAWSPDGNALYFVAPEAKSADEKAREKAKDDVYAFDENYKQTHLWKVTVATRTETAITSGNFSVTEYHLSNDGSHIAMHRAPTPLLGSREEGEVWISRADGTDAVQLTHNAAAESDATISPDNALVMFIADTNERFEPYYQNRVFVVPASGGPAHVIAGSGVPYDIERAAWSTDGKAIYFVANLGVHSELFEMPAAGGPARQLTDGQHAIAAWNNARGTLLFTASDSTTPAEVWTLPAGATAPVRVTRVHEAFAREFRLGRQEAIEWKGADGATIQGLLTYPADYQAGRKYPLVVMTHGGPRASDKYGVGSTAYELQILAGKGYAVLQPNYRGSVGYGDNFLRDMVGHYFQNAHLDVMAGVDEVIRRGVADPDRMVKMGWSAGGHMTNKIITFTTRFKAAASGAGAANWVSMYAQSDVRSNRTPWFGGSPWQPDAPIDAYWASSPLKDVGRVKTPTIFFVGERDPRVPMPQSIEMYRALRQNGVPTHLYVAPREPHGWAELRHELFKMNLEIEWFERYATNRPYTWEKAPGATPNPTPTP